MPASTDSLQTRLPASYQAPPARGRITALPRQVHQLIPALIRWARHLRLPRPDGYKLEPMPPMRWYS